MPNTVTSSAISPSRDRPLAGSLRRCLRLSLLLAFAAAAGCSKPPDENPYIVDSGYRAAVDYVHWLDDHRVIFVGKPVRSEFDDDSDAAITIWDTRTNTFERYRRASGSEQLCAGHGWISYWPRDDEVSEQVRELRPRWQGPLGEEELFIAAPADGEVARLNRYSCRYETFPDTDEYRGWHRLRVGDGWLSEVAEGADGAPCVTWRSEDGVRSKQLRLSRQTPMAYSEFHDAYLIPERPAIPNVAEAWKAGNCYAMNYLQIDNDEVKVRRDCLPWAGLRVRTLHSVLPMRGAFYAYGGLDGTQSVPDAAYVVSDSGVLRLLSGPILGMPGLSADGCQLTLAPSTRSHDAVTLKRINACQLMEELADENKEDSG